jgi:hypothetical protein
MRYSIIDYFLICLFSLIGLMFFTQVVAHFIVKNSDSPLLLTVHSFIGIGAILSAVGIRQQARYATIAVLTWGVVFAGNIISFIPIVTPELRSGFWAAAAIILCFTAVVLFYLRGRWRHARSRIAGQSQHSE